MFHMIYKVCFRRYFILKLIFYKLLTCFVTPKLKTQIVHYMENDFEEEYFSANEFQNQSDEEYFSANEDQAISMANELRDYSDVYYYFREYPTAVLLVRMPSGQI